MQPIDQRTSTTKRQWDLCSQESILGAVHLLHESKLSSIGGTNCNGNSQFILYSTQTYAADAKPKAHLRVKYFHTCHADDLLQKAGLAATERLALPEDIQVEMPAPGNREQNSVLHQFKTKI
eukprot:881846-Pelagomonas_calceolata.AAC.4